MIENKLIPSITQAPIMTQRLQQSINLLQLSSIELDQYLELQFLENPVLDLIEINVDEKKIKSTFNKEENYSELLNTTENLKEKIIRQISLTITCPKQLFIAYHLYDNLEEDGYLRIDLSHLAKKLDVRLGEINLVLLSLQQLEPTGIFARNLSECLSLQLADLDLLDDKMIKLIDNLSLIANNKWAKLMKNCGLSTIELIDKLKIIKTLNPTPGETLVDKSTSYLKPDIILTTQDNKIVVELNQANSTKVVINDYYLKLLKDPYLNKQTKDYLDKKIHDANWLINSLQHRSKTLLRVSLEIIKGQDDFFRLGFNYLKPLKLMDISLTLNIHQSTISRIIRNKYMATPYGLFELKYFFTKQIKNNNNLYYNSENIRYLIAKIVAKEKYPLSDLEITKILLKDQINIARRTVSKYRMLLKIANSANR